MAPHVEIRQLRSFVAVAEELNFTRAAARLFLTQPALSQQIRTLETLLDVSLFDRGPPRVTLTAAGHALLPGARRILHEVERAVHEARRAGTVPTLVLGYVEHAFQAQVGPLIQALRRRHPEVQLERRDVPHTQLANALRQRDIDIGFGMVPAEDEAVAFAEMAEGHWQVVMPIGHPLADLGQVSLDALDSLDLVMSPRALNPVLHDMLLERFRWSGVEPQVVFDVAQRDAGPQMVELGVGLWITSTFTAGVLPPSLTARRLTGFAPVKVGVVWRMGEEAAPVKEALGTILQLIDSGDGLTLPV